MTAQPFPAPPPPPQVINARGERWELQFKGAGRTPYSRQVRERVIAKRRRGIGNSRPTRGAARERKEKGDGADAEA